MKSASKRSIVVPAICAGIAIIFLAAYWAKMRPLPELEAYTQDLQTRFGRKTPVDQRLVLIGVDKPVYLSDFSEEEIQREPALRHLQKNFPWSRAVWARLIEKLGDAGAKAIVFDLVFAAPGEGDEELQKALEKYKDQVVVGYNISETETDRGLVKELQIPNSSVFIPHAERSILEDDRLGFVNIWTDFDDTLRRARYRMNGEQAGDVAAPDVMLESLSARALRKFGRADLIPPGTEPRLFRYTGSPSFGYVPHPIGDVLSPKLWERNYGSGKYFEGKIVLIGPTSELFHDSHPTPFAGGNRQMRGPEIHLNIINAALHGEFLREPALATRMTIIAIAGVFAGAISSLIRQPFKKLGVIAVITVGYCFLVGQFFGRAGAAAQILVVATPTLVVVLSGVIVQAYDYLVERFEKRRIRKKFERYVSRDVVKDLLDNPESFVEAIGGKRREVAVLFSDVRNFTTMTESADPGQLVKQLNEYFEEMVKIVFANSGSLDKFIGDAVMAVWGNIKSQGANKDACNAVATALAMKQSLIKLNEGWKSRGIKELAFGIGINYGEAIVGEMGSTEKVEFTAIGDAVNLASRLEGLTKKYHLDLLLGETVAPLVKEKFILRTVDYVVVKGKTKAVDVFTMVGELNGSGDSLPWLAAYENGVKLYRQRKFAEGATAFEESLRLQANDYLTEMYLKSCREFVEHPPGPDWDGTNKMTEK